MVKQVHDTHLESFVGVRDDADEQAEHNVNEQANERVQVDLAENPHSQVGVGQFCERHVHVIPIDQRVQTLGSDGYCPELQGHKDDWSVYKSILRNV